METHSILICLEQLGSGGVETAVINQAVKFKNLGNEVIILAKEGIYKEILEQKGIVCISFDYEIQNNYCLEKSEQILQIIEQYKIDQIHIHQFPCAAYLLPICLSKKIPYIVFLHSGQLDVYDWFMNTYPIYSSIFNLLFKHASKIISITETAKEYTSKKFSVPKEKYMICNNEINFDLYEYEEKNEEEIRKILLLSRISAEKVDSIKYAINLFIDMYENSEEKQKMCLTIAGDGEKKEEIFEYLATFSKKYPILLLGESNKIPQLIKEHDMVMAMGRGIIEAIAMKRLAFIVGYTGLKGIVTPENIQLLQEENFTGRNKKDITTKEALEEISNVKYQEVIEKNYDYLYENLNIKNTIEKIQGQIFLFQEGDLAWELFKQIQEGQSEIENKAKEIETIKNELEQTKKQAEITKEITKEEILKKNTRIADLEKELSEVYQSKRWRYADKILKIFN